MIIEIEALKFGYGNAKPILDISSFQISKGERVFVYGPSGSGKTTLLGLLTGVLLPREGRIKILGQELSKISSAAKNRFRGAHIGYIFQMFNLIPYLSVLNNILLSSQLSSTRRKRLEKEGALAAAKRLAQELGLTEHLAKKATDLSVGQQQRVAVARALLGSPELIIADEPTSSLDYDHRERFLQLLFQECEQNGSTLIFVSHDRSLEPLFGRSISIREISK